MKSIQYDYLVLATGLRPRKLPSSLPGYNLRNILYLRSLDDAINLVSKVKLPETKNIVIIGDSFIALELCGWLTTGLNEKKNISVIMRSKIPMFRM
jgi:NADPH-dependent 2,4-dienoyl-CoA reductase/sulfur reductase-like enzyme